MPDYSEIYHQQAEPYEDLVSREDYQGFILPELEKIMPMRGRAVVDLGAGTGRLAGLLAPLAGALCAFDLSHAMLSVAAAKLRTAGLRNWTAAVADHRAIPLPAAWADAIVSGWSVCYLAVWHPEDWQAQVERGLAEMRRVLRPGGVLILLETLGTGAETPDPPKQMRNYLGHLDRTGFRRTWIRTDYRFENRPQAERLTRFFFGEAMLEKLVVRPDGVFLSECTGIWSRTAD
jgi:ubiquinone/menaquinone biosynthesis C-methylase UbiE